MKMLGILDIEVLWKVIGSVTLSSRRFPLRASQNYDTLPTVNVSGISRDGGISVDGKNDLVALHVLVLPLAS